MKSGRPVCGCGATYNIARQRAGYRVCLACGEREAQASIEAKRSRVAPAYNKGGYQYLGDGAAARDAMLDAGAKTSRREHGERVVFATVRAAQRSVNQTRRVAIALYRCENGERRVLYSDTDLSRLRPERIIWLPK